MSVFSMAGSNPALPTYPIQRSVRLRSSASAYFNRTPAAAGNQKTFTLSCWFKGLPPSAVNAQIFSTPITTAPNAGSYITFASGNLAVVNYVAGATDTAIVTTQVFRDPSAWYHLVISIDTTQATSTNRVKFYINGVQVTAFGTTIYPTLNSNFTFNSTVAHLIGAANVNSSISQFLDGYLTEVNFIDGYPTVGGTTYNAATWAALNVATLFGAYNSYGVWSPAKYTGTYGTNGFYLNFQDNSTITTTVNVGIGADSSGNGNYWKSNNISLTAGATYDSMLDVPTLTSATNANFCVVNPIFAGANGISNANLTVTYAAASIAYQQRCTFTPASGQWYYEANLASFSVGDAGNNAQVFGWSSFTNSATTITYGWLTDGAIMRLSLRYAVNGVQQSRINIDTVTPVSTDIFALAFDISAGTITAYKNGVQKAQITSVSNVGDWTPIISRDGTSNAATWNLNFGQRPFSYTPPTGFNRLCTYNLPDSIVPVGAQYMAATLYTGNASTQTITNTVNGKSLQPDFVWTKSRTQAYNHQLYDSVRGATNWLQSNSTTANQTNATTLTSFNSNGFTVGANDNGNFTNGGTAVGWQWRASNASAVTNTNGALTSQVSVNQTAGFSIVTWTGTGTGATTVGHGLSTLPQFVIIKKRSTTGDWYVASYASGQGLNYAYHLFLNTTGALSGSNDPYYMGTQASLTSNVLSLAAGNPNNGGNESGTTYVAYCWTPVPGYSAFGSYTGNGSADGPFVYLGFRPRFLMIKKTDTVSDWWIWDTSRNTYNQMQAVLYPNLTSVEVVDPVFNFDALSNGFKNRSTNVTVNGSGATYIYAAFAENPFKNSLAR